MVRVIFGAGLVAVAAPTSVSPVSASPINAGVASLASAALAAEGDAKVDEQVVAPGDPAMLYFINPAGCNIVTVSPKGSRFVGIANGVETPKFDKISNRVAFSPDGKRHA